MNNNKVYHLPDSEGLLAPLKPFLEDKSVSEILMNKPQQVWVERKGVFQKYDILELTQKRVLRLFSLIARENKQSLNDENPILAGSLQDGTRIQCVIPPVSEYPVFAIRRIASCNRQLADYESAGAFNNIQKTIQNANTPDEQLQTHYQNQNWYSFLQSAIEQGKNIVISGGTSSGKTTFLNACVNTIPFDTRLLVLEDTREVTIPHQNSVSLLSQKNNKANMQSLIQCCLRLRPDRIIMGEIRGREILDFIGACATGHDGSMTTLHANNPKIAFMRMAQLYKQNNVPAMKDEEILAEIKAVVDIIVQLNRTKAGREITHIYYKDAVSV